VIRNKRFRPATVLVAAGMLGVLAACSGGATPPPAASPTTAAAATQANSQPGAQTGPVPAAPSTPAGGTDGNPDRCTTAELAGSLGAGDAGAGSVYQALVLTNTGKRTCELRGFPGVSYVAGDDGHQVGPAADMSGPRGGEVRMSPGGTAVAQLQLVNVQNFDADVCKPTPVRGLRIYPPGDTASLFVPREGTGCAGTPPGPQLSVQTVKAP